MNMILKKFSILALIFVFVDAAPADVNKSVVTTDASQLPTEASQTTTDASSTILPDTSTSGKDSSQNEVDVKFAAKAVKMTKMSDVDEKIESIEFDGAQKKIEETEVRIVPKAIEVSTVEASALQFNEKLIELTTEKVTNENIKVTSPAFLGEQDVTTSATVEEKAEQKVEAVQELQNNNQLEKLQTEGSEELFTTPAISQPSSTTNSQTTEVTPQSRQSDESISSQSPDLTARVKALEKIRNLFRAHILRNLVTLLNDARRRQSMQTHDSQHALESQVIEDIVPTAAASDCDCETENDDVSTNDDDDKIITFEENLQRYVEKKDYDMMNSSESRLNYVYDEPVNSKPSPRVALKKSSINAIKKFPEHNYDGSSEVSPRCASCSLEGYEKLLNY